MPGHPDVDYAAGLADSGEISLVIDRLGYGASPVLIGHEHAPRLASRRAPPSDPAGSRWGTAAVPELDDVIVHAHSVGAAIAQAEASKWKDVDGLVLMSWSDAGVSPRAIRESALQHAACLLGGGRDGAPRGYAWNGRTEPDFRSIHFATAADGVQQTAAGLRNPDPCGDAISLAQLVTLGNVLDPHHRRPRPAAVRRRGRVEPAGGGQPAAQRLRAGSGRHRPHRPGCWGCTSARGGHSRAPHSRAQWLCATSGCT